MFPIGNLTREREASAARDIGAKVDEITAELVRLWKRARAGGKSGCTGQQPKPSDSEGGISLSGTTSSEAILDNLGSHKAKAVRQLIRAARAKLLFLPKYSTDLNRPN
jgi:hypothetical protein